MSEENIKKNSTKVLHFEDFAIADVNETLVGRKGLSLFQLHNFDAPVPDFFVLSPSVFFSFTTRVFKEKKKDIESLKETLEKRDIANMFSRFDFDDDVISQVLKNYTKLSGFTDAWVSVRSSVSFPKRPEVSFSGVFDTQLNVRGFDNLLKAIKQVYASVYSDSVVKYCVNENIDLSEVGLAIVVQKMVQPEVSGVAFTVDPITQDDSRMSVEAVYGLGDVISNGDITPDSYVLLKKDLAIIEKHIAPQEWMKVRTLKAGGTNSSEKIQISPAWSHRQKVEDRYIVEISKIGLRLEEQMGESLDIEWVLSGGRVWILQSKNTFAKPSILSSIQVGYTGFVADTLYKVVKDILSGFDDTQNLEKQALQEATRYIEREMNREKVVEKKPVQSPPPQPAKTIVENRTGQDFVLSGIGASLGLVQGSVKVLNGKELAVTKNDIVVMKKYENDNYGYIVNAGGVITDIGGLTSDVAILCRELNIPAIVGTSVATSKLKNGDVIKMDGNAGSVYLIDEAREEMNSVASGMAQKLETTKVEDTVKEVVEKVVVSAKVTKDVVHERAVDLPHTATKVYISNPSLSEVVNSDGVVYISLDQIMLEDGRHPLAYVAEKKYKEYADRIASKIDEVASAASPNEVVVSIGGGSIGKFKKLVKGKEFELSLLPDRTFGVTKYLDNPKMLDLVLRIVKRTRNVLRNRNVSLAVHSPLSGNSMKEIKKSISASGLRRTSTFKLYSIIENPSEIIVLDDILSADIDGVILNTPAVARQMNGLSYDTSNTVIDLAVGSVFKVVDNVVDISKKSGLRVVVVAENSIDLLKYCVKKGVYGVVVDTDVVASKKFISEQEMKILLGR